ncbi:MAG: chemotaxis protein CheW [Thermodesulfobacteriota bacterium]
MFGDNSAIIEDELSDVTEDCLQFVTFKLQDEEFAIEVLKVQEIIRPLDITRVPKCAGFIEGVISLRGKVIPIINMRKRFDLPLSENTNDSRVIVVDVDGKAAGLIVDSVSEICRLGPDSIEPRPASLDNNIGKEYIKGIGKQDDRLIVLLEIDKVLNSEEKEALGSLDTELF